MWVKSNWHDLSFIWALEKSWPLNTWNITPMTYLSYLNWTWYYAVRWIRYLCYFLVLFYSYSIQYTKHKFIMSAISIESILFYMKSCSNWDLGLNPCLFDDHYKDKLGNMMFKIPIFLKNVWLKVWKILSLRTKHFIVWMLVKNSNAIWLH